MFRHNRKREREATRGLPTNSTRWRRIRAIVLADNPLCVKCERLGRVVPATDVDHIDGDSHNNERDNLQALCRSCHTRKTNREQAGLPDFPVIGLNGEPDGW